MKFMHQTFLLVLVLICLSACENATVQTEENGISLSRNYFILSDEFQSDTLLTYVERDGTIFHMSCRMLDENSYMRRTYDSTLKLKSRRAYSFDKNNLVIDEITYYNPKFQYSEILENRSLPLIENEETHLHYTVTTSDVFVEKEITYQMNGNGNGYIFRGEEKKWVRFDYKRTVTLTDSIKSRKRVDAGYMIFADGIGLVENTYKYKIDSNKYDFKSAKLLKIGTE